MERGGRGSQSRATPIKVAATRLMGHTVFMSMTSTLSSGGTHLRKARFVSEDLDDVEIWNREDASELERPGSIAKYAITVAPRDWTIETIVSQVKEGNIDLDPAFQRRNAWRDHRRSRLIESFILGFPVPQIVLAENPRRRGTFIVIDGKQRLMTIAGLYLPEYRSYWTHASFSGLDVLTALNTVSLDNFLIQAQHSTSRRALANAAIRTAIIMGFREESVLYDIFYRINTGSVPLSSQELRQVLNRGDFAKYLLQITGEPNPLWDVLGIESPDPRLRDVELLLRLLALRRFSSRYRGNMKAFLDASMSDLNDRWTKERRVVEELAGQMFSAIETALKVFGHEVGRKFKAGRYEHQLNRALFEVQAYYFSFPKVRAAAVKNKAALVQSAKRLFADKDFVSSIESTTKSLENYRTRFEKYRLMLEQSLGFAVESIDIPSPMR
jgi:hypothetical protein